MSNFEQKWFPAVSAIGPADVAAHFNSLPAREERETPMGELPMYLKRLDVVRTRLNKPGPHEGYTPEEITQLDKDFWSTVALIFMSGCPEGMHVGVRRGGMVVVFWPLSPVGEP